VNLDLNIRGIFTSNPDDKSVYFNAKYVEEAVSWFKGRAGTFSILAATAADVSKVSTAIDDMFRNAPQPTKAESEKAFGLEFVAMMGNVKAFILSICSAVVFATLLVSANTMAMSIRERTREVAVLKTLGFTRQTVLRMSRCAGRAGGHQHCLLAGVRSHALSAILQFFSPKSNTWSVPGSHAGCRIRRFS